MTPPDFQPVSSYSDPIYDRLEVFVKFLARNWGIAVGVALVAIILPVFLLPMLAYTPQADSAARVINARGAEDSVEKLEGLLEDEAVTPEFKAIAANLLVNRLLGEGDPGEARDAAEDGLDMARQAGSRQLEAVHLLNLASIDLRQGILDDALARYTQVQDMQETELEVESLQGTVGVAMTRLALADAAEAAGRTDESTGLRRQAVEDLDFIAKVTSTGSDQETIF